MKGLVCGLIYKNQYDRYYVYLGDIYELMLNGVKKDMLIELQGRPMSNYLGEVTKLSVGNFIQYESLHAEDKDFEVTGMYVKWSTLRSELEKCELMLCYEKDLTDEMVTIGRKFNQSYGMYNKHLSHGAVVLDMCKSSYIISIAVALKYYYLFKGISVDKRVFMYLGNIACMPDMGDFDDRTISSVIINLSTGFEGPFIRFENEVDITQYADEYVYVHNGYLIVGFQEMSEHASNMYMQYGEGIISKYISEYVVDTSGDLTLEI